MHIFVAMWCYVTLNYKMQNIKYTKAILVFIMYMVTIDFF
jgi:hypothetical protein